MSYISEYRIRQIEIYKKEGYQKYPKSKIKDGAILYKVSAFTFLDNSSGTEVEEWHIRTIRMKRGSLSWRGIKLSTGNELQQEKRCINCVQKIKGITWGKLSTKNGDFGFFKNIKNKYKVQFNEGDTYLPEGFFTTVLAASKFAYKRHLRLLKSNEEDLREVERERDSGEVYDPEVLQAELECYNELVAETKLLKSRLTKVIKASKTK